MKPDTPVAGFRRPGLLEVAAAAVEVNREKSGKGVAEELVLGPSVDAGSIAAAAKLGQNGNGSKLENVNA
jgi:hypothetical protein